MRRLLLGATLLLALGARAHAEVTIESLGQASGYEQDPEATSRRAIEDANRQAVDQVLGGLVDPATRKTAAELLRTRILRRARAYVLRSQVLTQGLEGGVWQVQLEVVIDDQLLRRDLVALKVPLAPVPPGSTPGPGAAPTPSASVDGQAVLVVVVGEPPADGLVAPLMASLARLGVRVAGQKTFEAPRDDQALAREAAQLGVGRVLVVSAALHEGGRIRGTPLVASEVEVGARIVEAGALDRPLPASVRIGAPGAALPEARAAAFARVAALAAVLVTPVATGEGGPAASPGTVLVRVLGVTRWREPDAIARALAQVPGVTRVVLGELARGSVTLVVHGRVPAASLARALPVGTARARGAALDVTLPADAAPAPVIDPR